MNYTILLKKTKGLLLWIYKRFMNKFTNVFSKLKDRFPVINRYPLLKHSLIPLLIAMFFLLRYIIKFVINEIATWTSRFIGETSGYNISERVIVLSIVAMFIILRIVLNLGSRKKKNLAFITPFDKPTNVDKIK